MDLEPLREKTDTIKLEALSKALRIEGPRFPLAYEHQQDRETRKCQESTYANNNHVLEYIRHAGDSALLSWNSNDWVKTFDGREKDLWRVDDSKWYSGVNSTVLEMRQLQCDFIYREKTSPLPHHCTISSFSVFANCENRLEDCDTRAFDSNSTFNFKFSIGWNIDYWTWLINVFCLPSSVFRLLISKVWNEVIRKSEAKGRQWDTLSALRDASQIELSVAYLWYLYRPRSLISTGSRMSAQALSIDLPLPTYLRYLLGT